MLPRKNLIYIFTINLFTSWPPIEIISVTALLNLTSFIFCRLAHSSLIFKFTTLDALATVAALLLLPPALVLVLVEDVAVLAVYGLEWQNKHNLTSWWGSSTGWPSQNWCTVPLHSVQLWSKVPCVGMCIVPVLQNSSWFQCYLAWEQSSRY